MKSLYISVCEDKDKVETDLNRYWQEKMEKEVQEVFSIINNHCARP